MKRILLLAFTVLSFFALRLQAEPYQHPDSGLTFPDSLGGLLKKGDTVDYEQKQKGLGVSLRYSSQSVRVDIYLYTMGMKSIPDGVNSPAIAKHMEQCCAELIEAGKRGIYNDVVQMAKPEAIKLAPSSKRSILISDFTLSMKGVPSISKVCLMGSRGQFLKIRCTYPVDRKEEAEKAFSKLLEDLAVVIDAQQA